MKAGDVGSRVGRALPAASTVWRAVPALRGIAVAAVVLCAARAHADDLSNVLGVTHIDGKYYFGSEDYLDQGADQVLATGSKVIKLEMDSQTPAKYSWNSTWPTASSLTGLAQTPYFQSLFSKPFNTYVITAYSIGIPSGGDGTEYWLNGMTAAQKAAEQQSFYNLTRYLMTTYNGTGKTFLLENWEGDWALRDGAGNTGSHNGIPTATNVQGMIDWFNAREAGIRQARAELGATSNVKVYGTVEVNRVLDAMNPSFNEATVTNNVLPFTNVDFASYSSYDTQESTTDFPRAVSYIASHLPASALKGQNTHSVYVGEFGEPEGQQPASQVNATINNVLNTVQTDGMPYALYWQIYSNELVAGVTPPVNGNNPAVRGFYLVKPDGTPATAWHQYRQRIITSDPNRASTTPIIAAEHNVYQSAFPSAGGSTTSLGPGWTTGTFGGDFNITANSGMVDMQAVNNAAAYPYGLATLNIPSIAGKGLSIGDYLQFTLRRASDAGIVGVGAFDVHQGSSAGTAASPLNAFSHSGWTPLSFAAGGTIRTYDWDVTHTLGLRLDSADGNFATISYYIDGSYSGSWLYPTADRTLDSVSLFAQSNVLNSSFEFGNLQTYFVNPVLPGDTNADGKVDFTDLLTLAQHYGQSGATWQQGDFNASGTVDFADLLALAQHYGQSQAAGAVTNALSPVPEPVGITVMLGTVALLRRRRAHLAGC
jgi:hypothetical protein